MGFWNNRWNDIRGNLLWQVLMWIVGGWLLSGIIQAIRASQHVPFAWGFAVVVFFVSALSIAVLMLLAARPGQSVQQQGSQSLMTPSAAQLSVKALDDLYRAVDVRMTQETEGIIRKAVNEFSPVSQRENFLIRIVTVGWIVWDLETIWYNIYRSQIELLQQLNAGPLTREEVFPYYSGAAVTYPHHYTTYSFDQWIGCVRGRLLLRIRGICSRRHKVFRSRRNPDRLRGTSCACV